MKTLIKIDLIVNYLKEHKMTKAELCKKAGVSIGVLNKILTDKRNIRLTGILKISAAIGVKSIFNY